jgi:SAM-dependent methyltransferase
MKVSAPLSANAAMRWAVVSGIVARLSPATILEIGCGRGSFGSRLATRARYLGLEPDEASCSIARARIEPCGGAVRNAGWEQLIGEQRFDLVCAFEVLEHLADDSRVLEAWTELVTPQGSLLISVPAWPERFAAWDRLAGHFRRYAPSGLARQLENAGYLDPRVVVYGWPLGFVLEAIRVRIANRMDASDPVEKKLSLEQRTAQSGRVLQPTNALGRATQVAVLPFIALQRLQPQRGTGIVAVARRPGS